MRDNLGLHVVSDFLVFMKPHLHVITYIWLQILFWIFYVSHLPQKSRFEIFRLPYLLCVVLVGYCSVGWEHANFWREILEDIYIWKSKRFVCCLYSCYNLLPTEHTCKHVAGERRELVVINKGHKIWKRIGTLIFCYSNIINMADD